ncbi:NnrS family protein [Campylobacter canadensis]|nr:NnrS family protein [Campylobacter canadensis]MBZ7997854.1 NnrS family protein [Campylobacter canadensis]MBZ8000498.1 NnrS family protein [Campylobacter canadensis]
MKSFFLLCSISFSLGIFVYFFSDDFYNNHIFLFFDIALSAAYTGFILTALPAWLGFNKTLKNINIFLLFLFLTSALTYFINTFFAMFFMCIFWLSLSFICSFMCFKTKNFNSLILILFGFCFLKFAYFFTLNTDFLKALIHLNSAAIMLINFKISIAVSRSALDEKNYKDYHFIPNVYYKNLSVFTLILLSIFSVIFSNIDLKFLYIASAFMIFARLKDFHHKELLKTHYVLFLYISIFILGLAYLIYGLNTTSASLHLIFLSSICINILLVFNIAGLRHNGLVLRFFKRTYLSFILLFLTLLLRYLNINDFAIICLFLSFIIQFFMLLKIFLNNSFLQDA